MASAGLTTLQRMAAHMGVYGQHKVDSVAYFQKDIKLWGYGGEGGSGSI